MTLPLLDATGKAGNTDNTSTLAWSHTTNALPGRSLTVWSAYYTADETISGVTYGATPLTLLDEHTSGPRFLNVWYLLNPPAGTQTITITWTGNEVRKSGGSVTFSGVDITSRATAYGAKQEVAGDGDGTFGPYNITSEVGSVALDIVGYQSGSSGGSGMITAITEANQVELLQSEGGGAGSQWYAVAGSYKDGEASTSFGWTFDTSGAMRGMGYSLPPIISSGVSTSAGFIFSRTQNFYDELKRGLIPSWDIQRRYKEAYA